MTKKNKKSVKAHVASNSDGRVAHVNKLWTSLVQSAFDFFEHAVQEHGKSPKYGILHLAASVELFLKARLMAEHWTLIVSPKKSPTFDQLRSGEFLSVTLSEAFERLRGVLPPEEAVSKDAVREFESLATERNKVAHFFHSGLDGDESAREIVQRQCRVWLHLHRLLAEVWKNRFAQFAARLNELDGTMRTERKFLTAVFEDAAIELDRHRTAGNPIAKCNACGFQAMVLQDSSQYTHGQCLVCRYQHTLLRLECPNCEKNIMIESGYDRCPQCGHSFSPHEAGELIGGTRPDDDTGYSSQPINCCECGTNEVYVFKGRYVCMNCMEESDEISACGWCNEYNTGDMQMSYLNGCSMCDGMIGWKGDRD